MLVDQIEADAARVAVIFNDEAYSYATLMAAVARARATIRSRHLQVGTVITLFADYSPASIAFLLAFIEERMIVTLVTHRSQEQLEQFSEIASAAWILKIDTEAQDQWVERCVEALNPVLAGWLIHHKPGIVIFSSGSTGQPKAILHDAEKMVHQLQKTHTRRSWRVISFLLLDHIGGINALLGHLMSGNTIVIPRSRAPIDVADAIERHRVEALITSPTFLNLLLLSEGLRPFDLSSLAVINYSTEPMPEATLLRLRNRLPQAKLKQSYGSSETGVIQTESLSSDSLLIKIRHCESRIVDGQLQLKNDTSMVGYLNAKSPFTADGWFQTGDAIEVQGEYLKILGRASEMINVGGEKVYPAEVENVIQQMNGVVDVVVRGETNPILGQIVTAQVKLATEEDLPTFRSRLRQFCGTRLPSFKIPQKISLTQELSHNERFKRMRLGASCHEN